MAFLSVDAFTDGVLITKPLSDALLHLETNFGLIGSSLARGQPALTATFRTAAEKGLIDDPLAWYLFRDKRNITAHTYDETRAADVLAVVPQLVERVRFLLARIEEQDASR